MHKEAIIFDFDGVLIESERGGFNLLRQMLSEKYGMEMDEKMFRNKVGRSTLAFLGEYFSKDLSRNEIELLYSDFKQIMVDEFDSHISVHVGVIDFIKKNNGKFKLAIASMNTKSFIRKVTDEYGISEAISVVVTREDVSKHKPDPEIYTTTLDLMRVDRKEVVVVEDSRSGVVAAQAAGLDVFVIMNGINSERDFDGINMLEKVNAMTFEDDMSRLLL